MKGAQAMHCNINESRLPVYYSNMRENTNMTVIKIAEAVSYTDVCGSNKIFAQVLKTSPRNYRKAYK